MASSFLQKLDDAINPIVVKELRQAVQSRFVVAVLMLFLLLQLLYVGIYLMVVASEGRIESIEFQAGAEVFTALQVILLSTCMLFLPFYTGIRLTAERNEVNTDLLFITTLKPRAIISGKIVSAALIALLIFSACTPFMLFTFFLRGVDWPSLLFIISIDFVVVLGSVQLTVFMAVLPGNRFFKGLLGLGTLGLLIMIFSMTLGGTLEMLRLGISPLLEERDFWMTCVAIAVGVLGVFGLLYIWSVALISPPSSNRSLPVRLYMFLLWAVSGVGFVSCSAVLGVEIPFAVWIIAMSVLWIVTLLISINERLHWAPRVARSIPRRWWLRVPAFFFFTGAAGGILYAVGMMGLTVLAYALFRELAALHHWIRFFGGTYDPLEIIFNTMAVSALYAYCYAMTAVVVRSWLFPRLAPALTWVVLLILLALGSLIPVLFTFLIHFRDWRYEQHFYALLANPGTAFLEFSDPRRHNYQGFFLTFAGAWALLITALSVPWLFRQMRAFQPLREEPAPEVMPEADARPARTVADVRDA